MNKTVDADFLALPLTAVSDAAISTAKDAGASHVDVRIERTRTGLLSLRDARSWCARNCKWRMGFCFLT